MTLKSKSNLFIPILLLLLLFPVLSNAAQVPIRSIEGKVVKVSDGDTIQIETSDGAKVKVRLAGIDAPETEKVNHRTGKVNKPGQPFGEEAKAFVESVVGKAVRVDIYGTDQYHRVLAFVFQDRSQFKGFAPLHSIGSKDGCPSGTWYNTINHNCELHDRSLNIRLLDMGLAEIYKGGIYGPYKQELISAESQAKRAQKGMWSLRDKYESPRDFRKRHKVRGK